MLRIAVITLAVAFGLMFISQNMHSVQVNFPFTQGFEIRMVFLMIVWFAMGYGAAHLVKLVRNLKNREKQ